MFGEYLSFVYPTPESNLYIGTQDPVYVLISVLIAILAAYTALSAYNLAHQIENASKRKMTTVVGGLTLGLGVWAMHFIGMLGFSIACGISYDPWITLISMIPGMFASYFALNFIYQEQNPTYKQIVIAGIILGGGVGLMHYSGMAAMRMDAFLRYNPIIFAISLIVAVVLAMFALWVRVGISRSFPRLKRFSVELSAIFIGSSISGIHYTAMESAYFLIGDVSNSTDVGLQTSTISTLIATITLGFMILVLLYVFKASQKQLENSNHELLLQKMALDEHAIVSITDVKGNIIYINNKFCQISGYQRHELMGQNHRLLKSEETSPEFVEQMWKTIANGSVWTGEFKNKAKDGHYYWVNSIIVPFLNNRGKPYKYVSMRTDVTAEKLAYTKLESYRQNLEQQVSNRTELLEKSNQEMELTNQKLVQASQAKSEFLAMMSHEIRTPMNGIIGMTNLALKTELNVKQYDYIQKANLSANNLLVIINDILDFSKIEADKLEFESVNFNLQATFEQTMSLVEINSKEKSIELMYEIEDDVPIALTGDPTRLGQVLINLCNNAVKFTPEKGEITVSISCLEQTKNRAKIAFSVTDSGIGMTSAQLNKLFQPFTQADTSTTREYGGTGLGLTISKRITEKMGGEISVQSKIHQGSTFTFNVVLEKQAQQPLHVDFQDDHLKDLTVLIVDDNAVTRKILVRMLKYFDIQSQHVESGQEALAVIEKQDKSKAFDVVLMDLNMPDMDGVMTTLSIQNKLPIQHIPQVILVSAAQQSELESITEGAVFSDFIAKPVSKKTLYHSLISLTGQAQKQELPDNKAVGNKFSAAQAKLKGTHLLLVEDSEINQQIVYENLFHEDIMVDLANNGEEALEAITKADYDGILMDCMMPVMDGYEATRQIRLREQYKDIPIIALTANAMVSDVKNVLAAGMNDHIAKPIDVEQMFITMAKWFKPKNKIGLTTSKTDEINEAKVRHTEAEKNITDEIFKDLNGIDVQSGLAMASHSQSLYIKILNKYRQDYGDVISRIESLNDNKAYDELKAVAHKLKGESSHLGINAVAEIAAHLERAIINMDKENRDIDSDDSTAGSIAENIALLKTELSSVIDSLASLTKPVENSSAYHQSQKVAVEISLSDKEERLQDSLLKEVLRLIKIDVLEAESKLEELIATYPTNEVPEALNKISDHLFNLEHPAAINLINHLLDKN